MWSVGQGRSIVSERVMGVVRGVLTVLVVGDAIGSQSHTEIGGMGCVFSVGSVGETYFSVDMHWRGAQP